MAQHPPFSPSPDVATLRTPIFTFMRSTGAQAQPAQAVAVPQADAYAVIVQLENFASHRLWRDGRLVYAGGHARRTLALTDLADRYVCEHLSPHDNARFLMGRQQLDALSEELMGKRTSNLQYVQSAADPVAHNLAQALLPVLRAPDQADAMFVEHVMIALAAHVMRRYGRREDELDAAASASGMSPWQERRAKEYMAQHLTLDLTLEDVARECGMSRSCFARAFRQRTGMTPFEWLRRERVRRAKQMLRDRATPMSRIAAECGFTDQSHFTRVFTRIAGQSPRAWRAAIPR